jgi:GDPmannose 4,6-dehydratase
MKSALITGIAGQDGAFLAKLLLEKGYRVYGLSKQRTHLDNLHKLGVADSVKILQGDITDPHTVRAAIIEAEPNEIYNLAAQSHVGHSFRVPSWTCSVNYMGYLNVLLAAREEDQNIRIYQAGTSEMFGYAAQGICNENTPLQPKSPYAIAKTMAHWAGINARHEADQFVANGILFNHESPLRHPDFVTRKITMAVARIDKGEGHVLKLGNIDSLRDWGFAGDYVEGMWLMLQHDKPDDFVLATAENYSVREFVRFAFEAAGMDIEFKGDGIEEKGYVGSKLVMEIDTALYRPNDVNVLLGDYAKARNVLGWQPKIKLKQLVEVMVRSDMQ